MMRRITLTLLAALCSARAAIAADPAPPANQWLAPAPLSPEESRKAIVVPDGFAVELVAAEPLVLDPVAFAWGPDLRLWVVEMADYNWLPINDRSDKKPKGRIVYLTDTDGDGKYDQRTVFLDSLDYPTGVLPYRNGVLVTAAPDIIYAEDTTPGDANAKADKIEKLYSGFVEGNPQLRVNGLQWGLDNWIYCANGLSNGVVKSHKTGQTVDIRGRDIRIRPDTGEIEPASGASQFGRVRDDFGNWFGVDNSRLIIHYVLEDHYLRRNPHVAAPEPFMDLVTPRNPPCYPVGKKVERLHAPYMANRFTSACGIAVYRDDYLGAEMHGQVFICEPVHNLITRRVLVADGVSFKAQRVAGEEEKEFLASTDEWFRPVHLRTGPDGALYIADMYRAVIEHPQWLPAEFNKKVDWMQGSDRGRIYRVVRIGAKPRECQSFHKLDGAALAVRIDSTNGTQRDMAAAMLATATDEAKRQSVTPLQRLAGNRVRSTVVRIQSLSALHGIGALQLTDINAAAASRDPMLARFALRLCDDQPAERTPDAFLLIATTPSLRVPAVEMQMALSLGRFADASAGKLLVGVLSRNREDRMVAAAVMTAATGHAGPLAEAIVSWKDAPAELIESIAAIAGRDDDPAVLARLLIAAGTWGEEAPLSPAQTRLLAALLESLESRGLSLRKLYEKAEGDLKIGIEKADALVKFAEASLLSQNGAIDLEVAPRLIGRGVRASDPNEPVVKLVALLERNQSGDREAALVATLARIGDEHWVHRVQRWSVLGPRARQAIIDASFSRDTLMNDLLGHVEMKRVSPNELSVAQKQRLVSHKDDSIRSRAVAIFNAVNPDRAKLIESYRDALTLTGDLDRGKELFTKTCATCHRISGEGTGYGPDLGALSDRSPATLLEAILDPNRAVDSRYLNYVAETKEGETITGILTSETANGITLAGADGIKRTVLRKDLESLRSSGLSLMPEGLEQSLDKQGIADVLLYVITQSQPARLLAGMKLAEIKPDATGSFVMPVTSAQAFGTTITYEKEDNNLGSWTRREDYVVWNLAARRRAKYEVWLDYAADDKWKGNTFTLSVQDDTGDIRHITEAVPTTGTHDDYKQTKVGVVTLTPGALRVMLRPGGPITGKLMELRGVRLVPVKE